MEDGEAAERFRLQRVALRDVADREQSEVRCRSYNARRAEHYRQTVAQRAAPSGSSGDTGAVSAVGGEADREQKACGHDSGSECSDGMAQPQPLVLQPLLSAEVRDAAEAAERVAKRALELLLIENVDDAIAVDVKSALDWLAEIDRSTKASAKALLAMGLAIAAIPPSDTQLGERVTTVECNVRDVAIWRCQILVPIDNHVAFKEKLNEAFEGAFCQGALDKDKNIFSRLMHAHKCAVRDKVADGRYTSAGLY